jgi:PleD family two-component response regulator
VRGIILRHHGGIGIESALRKGTTFTVALPRAGSPTQDVGADERVQQPRRAKRVLVVDDEPQVRNTLVRVLNAAGLDVVDAGNGREAIEVFAKIRQDSRDRESP